MRIVTLMENSPGPAGCAFEHGLSFYIETERRRILSDTGASAAFLDNAALLGVPLETVDAVFVSHGHYDHAGGVLPFAQRNPRAVIYVQRTAELPYYAVNEDGFQRRPFFRVRKSGQIRYQRTPSLLSLTSSPFPIP